MRYITKRILQALFTTWVVVSSGFVLIRYMPGGPMDYLYSRLVSQGASPERAMRMAELYLRVRPDEPLWVQYIDYMTGFLLEGNMGRSVWFNEPVNSIVFNALPWTIFLMVIALLLTFVIGIGLGGVMALYEGSRFDFGSTSVTLFLNSVPYYIVGLLLLLFFGYRTGFFPTSGKYPGTATPGINAEFIIGVFYFGTLPILSLVASRIGGTAISMRANSISILGKDYIRVARLRGLSDTRIATRYVTHNAILPLYTGLMISIGTAFGGSIILERIFRYPGIGYYFFEATNARDYPLLMGSFILTTATVIAGVLFADFTYGLLDPRISAGDNNDN